MLQDLRGAGFLRQSSRLRLKLFEVPSLLDFSELSRVAGEGQDGGILNLQNGILNHLEPRVLRLNK